MTPVLLGSAPPMQRPTRDLVSGRHGGELVPSGECERRAAAGKAGAAKLKTLGRLRAPRGGRVVAVTVNRARRNLAPLGGGRSSVPRTSSGGSTAGSERRSLHPLRPLPGRVRARGRRLALRRPAHPVRPGRRLEPPPRGPGPGR